MNLAEPPAVPDVIRTEGELDEVLTRPGRALVDSVRTIASPLLVLGAGGKMGPTLAVLAKRAAQAANYALEVIAVSRFSDRGARAWLEAHQVNTVACDLLDAKAVSQLPDAGDILYMAGLKFGTTQNPAATWAINTIVPVRVLERYPGARIVTFSTGNVYPPSPVEQGGSLETAALTPLGEYANAAVGRERLFEFCSHLHGARVTVLRLFYAVELRYGVLVDIARKVEAGTPVESGNAHFNCIWQGDANEMAIRALSLAASPPSVWNLCRPEVFSVRAVASRLGELFGRPVQFTGTEAPTALLGNAKRISATLGTPAVPLETMLRWIAFWVKQGGRNLNKPTHFEARDGNY